MTMTFLHILTVLFILIIGWEGLGRAEDIKSCTKTSKCSCVTDTGKSLSLKGLKRQKSTSQGVGDNFIWEPCGEFDIGQLTGVSAVDLVGSTGQHIDIGTMEGTYFDVSSGHVNFFMQSKDKSITSLVQLTCSEGESKWEFKSRGMPFYTFELQSPYCCPGFSSTGGSSLSAGSIVLITFFVILVSYVIFGVVYNSAVRKAEGSARIPNAMFWAAIPGLIRDGFKLTLSKVCRVKTTVHSEI